MKMHHFGLFAAMVLTFAVTGPPAMAQTPDGSTPAVEGICDPLMADGVSKGLYGLCVAYCEAQDFSSETVPLTDAEILALLDAQAPAGRLLENYNKRRAPTDPEMPCVVRKPTGCPCFDQAQVSSIDGISELDGTQTDFIDCLGTQYGGFQATEATTGGPVLYVKAAGVSLDSGLGASCLYFNTAEPTEERRIDGITAVEAAACKELVLSAPICPQ